MRNRRGFTLVEMLLVSLLLGLVLALAVPNLIMASNLSSSCRQLVGMIRSVALAALAGKQVHRLTFNVQDGAYWASVVVQDQEKAPSDPSISGMFSLPPGIALQDVTTPERGEVASGRPFIQFSPVGRIERAQIHLTDGKDQGCARPQPGDRAGSNSGWDGGNGRITYSARAA